MGRFLIVFSYLGTRYSGAQKQANVSVKGNPLKTVSGALEAALKCMCPSNDIRISLSSRTDKGVHALKNTCHVDLEYPIAGREYHPLVITNVMNNFLKNHGEDIRVLQTRQVSETFSSRFNVFQRHYVYRLGHMLQEDAHDDIYDPSYKNEKFYQELRRFGGKKSLLSRLPLGEQLSTLDACKAVVYRTHLDINKLISAAELVSGIHNYSSFTSKRGIKDDDLQSHPLKMLTIGVKRGQPFGHQLQKCGLDVSRDIEFWDIHVQSRSFLYRQIRKLVGSMVLVARNVLSLEGLQDILKNTKRDFPLASQIMADESGLFLLNVDYKPKDLEFVPMSSLSEQQCASRSSQDAGIISSSFERTSEPSVPHDTANGVPSFERTSVPSVAHDTANGLSSEDDDSRPAAINDTMNSLDLKLIRSSKEMTESS